jgi:hypothetical protein
MFIPNPNVVHICPYLTYDRPDPQLSDADPQPCYKGNWFIFKPPPPPGSAPDQEQDEGGTEGCGAAPRGPGGDCGGQALVQARRHKEDQRSSQG